MSKELSYNLLTFTIFIIQSQIGGILVTGRLCEPERRGLVAKTTVKGLELVRKVEDQ